MNTEYSALLRELEERQEASLRRTVDGKTYTRAFTLKERLILLGAGHVSQATAQLAAWADFDVTVVDDRSAFASADRFPDAKEIICENFSSAIRNRLHIRPHDYVCVLTRGHRSDAECLRAVLPGEMPLYLGMIGSRRRVTAQIRLLEEEGFDPRRLSLIHTPIGLHIHAQTPREIAVSIVAELIQTRRSKEKESDALEYSDASLEMLRYAAFDETPKASVLVLEAAGSTPAKTGAMMILDRTGRTFGTVGGGSCEGAAMEKAMELIGTGRSEVISLDLSNDVAADEGMVCGGTMKLLVEDLPVSSS